MLLDQQALGDAMTAELREIDASQLVAVMGSFKEALQLHEQAINRLNVFPVPDGDTGTNMMLTVESVAKEIAAIAGEPTMALVAAAIAKGSLMGARGNSGVILCQILRGLAATAGENDALDAAAVAAGLTSGSDGAHGAVLRPAQGTILTVAHDAAIAATKALDSACSSLVDVIRAARDAAVESLFRTPELLAVLAAAGVVDAGGAGLTCLYEALLSVATSDPMPDVLSLPDEVAERIAHGAAAGELQIPEAQGTELSELRYEVMYLLDAADELIDGFKTAWDAIGDSIVVVGGDGLYNCHIHTNDIGASIEAAIDVGRPHKIRVTDLSEQVEEERWVRQAGDSDDDHVTVHRGPPPLTSVVTVGTGDGIRRVFRSLGVNHIVAGGQSMNPSTEELLAMIDAAPGSEVVVMPNNTNIYPVAKQAAELSKKPVYVIATAGVQEGFAALLDFDPQASGAENAAVMTEGASRVVCGEVTQAVRATTTAVGDVHHGDFIGLSRSGIESIASTLSKATTALLEKLIADEHEIVTIIEGSSVPAGELRRVTQWLADEHPEISLEHIHGDQPLYPFLLSIE